MSAGVNCIDVSTVTAGAVVTGAVMTCVLAALTSAAFAQPFPSKPLRMIVPWTPAGTVDIAARHLSERMTARLGQAVLVDNRPGATGTIGSQLVVRAPADGYTLLVMSATVHTFAPNLFKAFPFDPIDDFTPISQIVNFPYVMVVSAASPYRSVADLVAAARKEPGKLSYASFGQGSAPYLISELFSMQSGTQLIHVPYKGAAQAITDLLGGQITFFIDSLPSPISQVRAGKLRALSVTTAKRSTQLPDVPTMGETIPGFEAIAWLGIAAPPKSPAPVVQRLHEELRQIAGEAEYGAKLRDIGLDPVASASPEAFRKFLIAQKTYWGEFVKRAKIPMGDF